MPGLMTHSPSPFSLTYRPIRGARWRAKRWAELNTPPSPRHQGNGRRSQGGAPGIGAESVAGAG
jgi:hypothetical protein